MHPIRTGTLAKRYRNVGRNAKKATLKWRAVRAGPLIKGQNDGHAIACGGVWVVMKAIRWQTIVVHIRRNQETTQ